MSELYWNTFGGVVLCGLYLVFTATDAMVVEWWLVTALDAAKAAPSQQLALLHCEAYLAPAHAAGESRKERVARFAQAVA